MYVALLMVRVSMYIGNVRYDKDTWVDVVIVIAGLMSLQLHLWREGEREKAMKRE